MIDPKKTYRTRDGREVRIYAVDGGGRRPVHGAIREGREWVAYTWLHDGVAGLHCSSLIEVKPRIVREVWVNVYRDPTCDTLHHNGMNADLGANMRRIACVRLVIDCEEGTGL